MQTPSKSTKDVLYYRVSRNIRLVTQEAEKTFPNNGRSLFYLLLFCLFIHGSQRSKVRMEVFLLTLEAENTGFFLIK